MKLTSMSVAFIALCAATSFEASAQSLRSAYFSDSYLYRHHINPAMSNEDDYFSIPFLGNLSLDFGTNEGINTFIVPYNDKLVTFMHESVSASSFLSGLSDNVKLQQSLDLTLFSLGLTGYNGYHTFEIGLHQQAGIQLPKDLLSFMKEMQSDKVYNFSDMLVLGRAWADISYGYTHKIGENLRIGAKAKILIGLALADADIKHGTARFGEDEWQMQMEGQFMMGGASGTKFSRDEEGLFDGIDEYKFGIAGYGGAFDLGFTYDMRDIVDGLKLSASVNDLGFINWSDCANAYNNGEPFSFSGFNQFTLHNEDNHVDGSRTGSLSDQWDDITEDLEKMYNLTVGKSKTEKQWIAASVHVGAEYEIPSYKQLSFGLLLSHRFTEILEFNEARLNVNFGPSSVFDMALSAAFNSYGTAMGAMVNLHLPGFSLFLGSDQIYIGKINKNFIPLDNGGMNVQFGINIPL